MQDLANEKEFELLRAESVRHFWIVVPQCFLFTFFLIVSLASRDLISFRPLAAWNTFMLACNSSFQLWVSKAAAIVDFKERNSYRAATQAILTFIAYWVYFAFENQNNKDIMQGGRYLILPLASAWECKDEGDVKFFAASLVMAAVENVFRFLAQDGTVQRSFINISALGLIFQIMRGRASVSSDKETLTSLCRTVRRILGSMCDGYCVVNSKGVIVGADIKLVNMVDGTNLNSLDGKPLRSLMDDDEFSVTGECLKYAPLMTGDSGKVINSEVYSIAGEFTKESLRDILGHWCTDVHGKVEGYLCAVRESNMEITSTFKQPQCGSEAMENFIDNSSCGGLLNACTVVQEPDDEEEGEDEVDQLIAPSEADKLSQAPSIQRASTSKGFFPSMNLIGIGVGDYTKVELVYNRKPSAVWQVRGPSGQLFAMKELHLPGILWRRDFPGNLVRADRELRSLKRFQWASCVIVQIVEGWLREDMYLCIVMEWIPVTLKSVLANRRREGQGPPSVEDVGKWLSHVVTGLAIIHSDGYMHRDLKASNLLLTPDLQRCKIADFGLAREVRHMPLDGGLGAEVNSTIAGDDDGASAISGYTVGCGTKGYMSPEIKKGGNYGVATDIYSLGCILFDLLTLKGMETSLTAAMASQAFASHACSEDDVRELRALCIQMLDESPFQRPTAVGLTRERVLQTHLQSLLRSHPELERVIGEAVLHDGQAPDSLGLIRTDAHGLIMNWSLSLASVFGVPADVALGRNLRESFVPQEHRAEFTSLVRPIVQRRQEEVTGTITFGLPAGKQRLQVTAKAFRNQDVFRFQEPAGVQFELVSLLPLQDLEPYQTAAVPVSPEYEFSQRDADCSAASTGLRERLALRQPAKDAVLAQ